MILNQILKGDSISEAEIKYVCIFYTLIYLYFWIDLKEVVNADIDAAYSGIRDNTDEDEDTKLQMAPYDPISLIGPLLGLVIKSLLGSFLLYVLLMVLLLTSSLSSTSIDEDYLKESVTTDLNDPATWTNEDDDTLAKSLGYENHEAKMQNKGGTGYVNEPLFTQMKIKKSKFNLFQSRYNLSRDYNVISLDDTFNSASSLWTVTGYWLYFWKKWYYLVAAVVLCTVINIIFARLIIPHIKDIDSDPLAMKSQIEIVLYANLVIYLGVVWYITYLHHK